MQAGTSDMTVDIDAVPTMMAKTILRVSVPDLASNLGAKRLSNLVFLTTVANINMANTKKKTGLMKFAPAFVGVIGFLKKPGSGYLCFVRFARHGFGVDVRRT